MHRHSFGTIWHRLSPLPFAAFGARRGGPFDHRGGNPFGGNPFGGNPFWGNPFAGRGKGRGRARRGDVRTAILLLLAEQPRNGYQLMQEIEQRSHGNWRPSPGSVYPALQQLEDEGLVLVEANSGGKTFHLTELGRSKAILGDGEELPWEQHTEHDEDAAEFHTLIRQVVLAASQVAQAGSATQVSEASKLLTEMRRKLYRLLAQEDVED